MPDICNLEWYEYIFIAAGSIAITFTIINLLDITKLEWYLYLLMAFGGLFVIVSFCCILSRYGGDEV